MCVRVCVCVSLPGAGSAWVLLCLPPQQKPAAAAAPAVTWVETRAQAAERGGAFSAPHVPLCRSPPLTQDQTPPRLVVQRLFHWAQIIKRYLPSPPLIQEQTPPRLVVLRLFHRAQIVKCYLLSLDLFVYGQINWSYWIWTEGEFSLGKPPVQCCIPL